jgi:hypothetical protein
VEQGDADKLRQETLREDERVERERDERGSSSDKDD